MTEAQVTEVTGAFAPSGLLSTWIDFAPFILAGLGVLIAIGVVAYVVRKVTSRLKKGV